MSATTLHDARTGGMRLIPVQLPESPRGIVLVLHGGASRAQRPQVSPAQLSVLRMIPVARRVAQSGRGRLAVFRVLNSMRGWDTRHTPVADALLALREAREQSGLELPVALVGHSLGGRAALLAAEHPSVRSVVALAPWLYPGDAPRELTGRNILFVHGEHDRVASPERSAAVARGLTGADSVAYVSVRRGKHAMLRRADVFETLAAAWVRRTLLGRDPAPALDEDEPREGRADGIVNRALAGERWLEI
jgi:pimeloyl-ACP methyl ester carboxylesterase